MRWPSFCEKSDESEFWLSDSVGLSDNLWVSTLSSGEDPPAGGYR